MLWADPDNPVFAVLVFASYFLGIICTGSAVLNSRSPQGAVAWILSLLTIPFIAVPLYVLFGRTRIEGYNTKRRKLDAEVQKEFSKMTPLDLAYSPIREEMKLINSIIPGNNQPGFTRHNDIALLIDGEDTFKAMLRELERAENYIVFQTYIFRDDDIGNRFVEVLMRKAREGVRVSFLNDEIGNHLSRDLMQKMKRAGVKIAPFNKRGLKGKLQLNFRNHRKVIVIDGKVGFIGGLNIGDDYLGKSELGPWRDTHVRVEGPSVIAAQLASAKDWYFSMREHMDVDWDIHPAKKDAHTLVLHTGPADTKHSCLLAHLALVSSATKRLWLANPYLVPPESLMDAILLAALRGVDVRVLLPSYSDAKVVTLASKIYQERLLEYGVRVYRYQGGFLHQKVVLVDDMFAAVGSANLDYRSMFINFEVTAITTDKDFITSVEEMLERDLSHSSRLKLREFERKGLMDRVAARGANLLAPIL